MLLDKFDFWLMNTPIRAFFQERIEIKRMRKYSDLKPGKKILEIGCGNGAGARLIKKYFEPATIYANDIDPKMIKIAKEKVKDDTIFFQVVDATKLPFEDAAFDAVFDFGTIHHIEDWRKCLKELKRVLKSGGEVLLEDHSIETYSDTFLGRFSRQTMDHPYKTMYTQDEFFAELEKLGFKITTKKICKDFNLVYFLVIAQK